MAGAVVAGGMFLFGLARVIGLAIRAIFVWRRWRRRAVGEEFPWGKLAVAILVEFEQRFRRGLEFLGGQHAVLVSVERGDQWRRAMARRRRTWRPEFLAGDLAVAVLVEFGERIGRVVDFVLGDDAVTVRVEDHEDRRRWGWRAMAFSLFRFLCDGSAGQQGEGQMQGCGFHDLIRLVLAAPFPAAMTM